MIRLLAAVLLLVGASTWALTPTEDPALDLSIQKGVDFLVGSQNSDGSWGSSRSGHYNEVYAPMPAAHLSFRTGATAIALVGLIRAAPEQPPARDAVERGISWLIRNLPEVKRDAPDALYCNWAFLYGIEALAAYEPRADSAWRRWQCRRAVAVAVDRLDRYSSISGGWVYYDFEFHAAKPVGQPATFMTAAAVAALAKASALGVAVPEKLMPRGVAELRANRLPDDAFVYNNLWRWYPRATGSRRAGSLGRTAAGLYALRLTLGPGEVSDNEMRAAAERFLDRNDWLGIGRKRPIPHESWFQVAGYYYCFGHCYAARLINMLPLAEQPELYRRQQQILLAAQDPDGAWWDFPLYGYGKAYGTGFVLQALAACRTYTAVTRDSPDFAEFRRLRGE